MLPGSAWNRSLQLSVSCCQISSTNTGRVFFFRSRAGGLAVKQSSSHHKTQEAFEITAPTVRRRRFASHFCKTGKKVQNIITMSELRLWFGFKQARETKWWRMKLTKMGTFCWLKKMEWKCRGKKRSVLGNHFYNTTSSKLCPSWFPLSSSSLFVLSTSSLSLPSLVQTSSPSLIAVLSFVKPELLATLTSFTLVSWH